MTDDRDDYWSGYNTPGAPSGDANSAYEIGRRAREDADFRQRAAARRARGDDRVEGPGALIGLVVLAALAGVGLLLWQARLVALSATAGAVTLALLLYGALALLKAPAQPLAVLGQSAKACGAALMAALIAGAGAWFLQDAGGPNLMPGIETLTEATLPTWEPGPMTFALPLVFGLAAGTWWLNRALPPTPIARPLRWAGLAGLLLLSPVAGAWGARAILSFF